ncbi:MAG: VOC family protein [bacterium]
MPGIRFYQSFFAAPYMITDCNLIAFVTTKDSARAKHFYENILGLKLVSDDMFALVFDANGTMLRVQKVKEHHPPPHTVLGWEVADIVAEVDELSRKGVEVTRYEGILQDDKGIWTAPGNAKIAWFNDPDGNILSLTQFHS